MNYDPEEDGVTHINIYSRANTELGTLLSNFAKTPFYHPKHGRFNSVEGFWYWVKTGYLHDELKDLYGFLAKKVGRELPIVHNPKFEEEIKKALRFKVTQNPRIVELLVKNKLPFTHYFNYKGKVVDKTKDMQWQIDAIESVIKSITDIA